MYQIGWPLANADFQVVSVYQHNLGLTLKGLKLVNLGFVPMLFVVL
jgi:hypothetical protein